MSRRMPKPIIALPPDMMTDDLRTRLEDAGYVVVLTDRPELVRVIEPIEAVTLDAVTLSALEACKGQSYAADKFGHILLARLIAMRQPKPAKPA